MCHLVAHRVRLWRCVYARRARAHHHRLGAGPARRGPPPRQSDAQLLAAIRTDLARSPFHGEGHRKVHARLRILDGIRVARTRVLRVMRAHGGEIDLVATEGSDRLYRIRPAIPTRVSALLHGLAWSEVTLAWPGPDTALRRAVSLRATFSLRSPDQLVVYMEATTANSRVVLDLLTPMTGELVDAVSGEVLKELSLRNAQNGAPAVVAVPPDREAVVLALHAP